MAVAKAKQELKRERQREKRALIDRLTNRFMINLAWGIVAIIALRMVENGFVMGRNMAQMPTNMKILAAAFAVIAIALFVCGKFKVIKNTSRCYDYAVFSFVAALVSLAIGFYAQIMNLIPVLKSFDSRWYISWGYIWAVIIYLAVMFVWTCIRVTIIEKGKK